MNDRGSVHIMIGAGALATGMLVATACAVAPPRELVAARQTYARAEHGPAKTSAPADLQTATEALTKAERAFDADGDDESTRDLAYVAERRAQLAEARAGLVLAEQAQKARAEEVQAAEKRAEVRAQAQAAAAREKAALRERAISAALTNLEKTVRVHQDSDRVRLTFSSDTLFKHGQGALSAKGAAVLGKVSVALGVALVPALEVRVPASAGEALARARVESVRDYLKSHGLAAAQIDAAPGAGDEVTIGFARR